MNEPIKPTQPIPKKSALIKTDRPRPHVCVTCTRAFARLEHLKRHERLHTNEKPFQCAACGRCFARRDLVLRHQQKLHAGLGDQQPPADAPQGPKSTRGRQKNNTNIIEHKNNTDKIKPLPNRPLALTLPDLSLPDLLVSAAPMALSASASSMGAPSLQPLRKISSGPAAVSDELLELFRASENRQEDSHHRHASFSAALAASYALQDEAEEIHAHDLPPAPHQVGFSTPQLSATELALRAALEGVDVDLNIDWDAFERFSLDGLPLLQEFLYLGGLGGFEEEVKGPEPPPKLEDNWLDEFIRTPEGIDINHIGFKGSKGGRVEKTKKGAVRGRMDIPLLFRDRQLDLFKRESGAPQVMKSPAQSPSSTSVSNPISSPVSAQLHSFASGAPVRANTAPSGIPEGAAYAFFTPALRSHIISHNSLSDHQFPLVGELNLYIFLYSKEFDNYFPFVHLPLIELSIRLIPLLLAVAAIGALYLFHLLNLLLLFGVSKFYIHNFLENNKGFQNDDVPLWLLQCLTLNMFLGVFNNDASLNKLIAHQLSLLVFLVKKCLLHMPLERFISPPAPPTEASSMKNNFDYFILAQLRIRTVHTILLILVLFDTLIGAPIVLKSEDILCGLPCAQESLWRAPHCQAWFQVLEDEHILLDLKCLLVSLSNGVSFAELVRALNNHSYADLAGHKVGHTVMLLLLMYVHQQIYEHRVALHQVQSPTMRAMTWRMKGRVELEALLRFWELLFIKNEGILIPSAPNIELINRLPVLKLILPLLLFAKIRLCLLVASILERVWAKDWAGMNKQLTLIESDPDALRESLQHALAIIELWIDLISVTNDAQSTAKKTPIFFLTCTFTLILFLLEYLYTVEKLAGQLVAALDTALFVRVSTVLKKVLTSLAPDGGHRTFAELLATQANGAFDFESLPKEAGSGNSMEELVRFIKGSRLSSKCLYLGIRILADAPIWPAAVLFAEALKARSMEISEYYECHEKRLPVLDA